MAAKEEAEHHAAFWDALGQGQWTTSGVWHNRDSDVVDGSGEAIADALIAAGWTYPTPPEV